MSDATAPKPADPPAAPAAKPSDEPAAPPAPTTSISAFADPPASTVHDLRFAEAAAAANAATQIAPSPPTADPHAATLIAPSPGAGAAPSARDATALLPPPLPFSRIALGVIVALLVALTAFSWHAMRATAALGVALAAPPPAPPEAAPTPTQLADDTWFTAACRDHPERAAPLWRARARALAGAGDAAGALAAWDALTRAARGDATLDDALGRAETLAELHRWDDALAALAKLDVEDASPPLQRRAIALDGRCRLARERAAR